MNIIQTDIRNNKWRNLGQVNKIKSESNSINLTLSNGYMITLKFSQEDAKDKEILKAIIQNLPQIEKPRDKESPGQDVKVKRTYRGI